MAISRFLLYTKRLTAASNTWKC